MNNCGAGKGRGLGQRGVEPGRLWNSGCPARSRATARLRGATNRRRKPPNWVLIKNAPTGRGWRRRRRRASQRARPVRDHPEIAGRSTIAEYLLMAGKIDLFPDAAHRGRRAGPHFRRVPCHRHDIAPTAYRRGRSCLVNQGAGSGSADEMDGGGDVPRVVVAMGRSETEGQATVAFIGSGLHGRAGHALRGRFPGQQPRRARPGPGG